MTRDVLILFDESKTLLLGSTLAKSCIMGCTIYLNGHIGTGKTIFCKGFLQGLGYKNYVRSPTYTVIESYYLSNMNIHHCDCYRLNSAEALINTGIQDYFHKESIFLIEWPKQYIKILPSPDIIITINYDNHNEKYRQVVIETISTYGQRIISSFLYTKKFKNEIKI